MNKPKAAQLSLLPIILVIWRDSYTDKRGWDTQEAYREATAKPLVCATSGFLLQRNKQQLTVVQNMDQNGKVGEAMVIPQVCILRTKEYK